MIGDHELNNLEEIPKEWLYFNTFNLRKKGINYPYTQKQIDEILHCAIDKKYFIKNYVYITTDGKVEKFNIYPYQETICDNISNNRFNILKMPRQSGKTTTTAANALHELLFTPNWRVGIVANKAMIAMMIIDIMQDMILNLPFWLQQGVEIWNKGKIQFENGSRAISEATSPRALRGQSISHLIWDEVAFVESNIASQFLSSIQPTIAASLTSKITLSSTPVGYNHFAKLWFDAINKVNDFIPMEIQWHDVPGRDEHYKSTIIKNFGIEHWNQEYESVGGDTIIHVRHIKTGLIEKLTMEMLYSRLKYWYPERLNDINKSWEEQNEKM